LGGRSGLRLSRLWKELEALTAAPHAVQDNGQFVGHGDDGSLLGSLTSAGGQLQHRKAIPYSHSREMLAKVRNIVTEAALTDGFGSILTTVS